MKTVTEDLFENLSLDRLRMRKSEKWAAFPPDVLPAFVAEMDFDLAQPVRDALIRAIELGDCGYAGIRDLTAAFAVFARKRFDWAIDERRIVIVPDVMAGVTESIGILTRPGSGVVINTPVYPPFFDAVRSAQRDLVEVPLLEDRERGWLFDFDGLERAFAAGARALLLCSPHNPLGRVWTADELQRISQIARAYSAAVISDEVHAPLAMPGVDFRPFLPIAGNELSCTAISSASKAWNIAGLKCALLVSGTESAAKTLRERARMHPTEFRDRVGHLGAIGSISAFRGGGAWLDALRAHLDRNARLMGELLREKIPRARYTKPDASYLAWVDCAQLHLGEDPRAVFLTRGKVALEAGYKFGKQGAQFVRVNMGTSTGILREIVDRMASALGPLM